MKQLLKLLLFISLSCGFLISCTSNKTDDSGEISSSDGMMEGDESLDNLDAALDGADDFGGDDFAADFGDDFGDEFGDSDATDEFGDDFADSGTTDEFGDDFADSGSTDDFGSDFADSGTTDDFADSSSMDTVAEEAPLMDDSASSDFAATEDSFGSTDSFADSSSSFTESSEDSSFGSGFSDVGSTDTDSFMEEETTRTWVPVKKMATVPFNKGGQLLNTIYIIRDGDTVESVSSKIYGQDRSGDILAANPHLNRSFKVGDKLYYNSPNRPSDSSSIITYYEDVGAPAQVYFSQEGDNIRAVAQELLGHPESWKEIWATNMSVESKGVIAAGLELRYYPDGSAPSPAPAPPSQAIASNNFNEMEMEPEMSDIPPPPPAPNMEDSSMGAVGSIEPPPPPPPPPPPVVAAPPQPAQAQISKKSPKGMFSDFKMVGAAILLIVFAIGLIIIQKNKSKKMNIGETQI